jgi:hypothetical protein
LTGCPNRHQGGSVRVLQIAGPPMPETSRPEQRLRDVFHYTIRAFQLQPKFYRVVMMLTATTDTYAADL